MRRGEVVLLALLVACGFALLAQRERTLAERLARHNAEAAADSSRLVYQDNVRRVAERLAFQEQRAIVLRGDLARALRAKDQATQMLARLRVDLDSLAGVVTQGSVTTSPDTLLRSLAATLDTAGFHVRVSADVPPPPSTARVTWHVRRDPVEIVAALNRDPEGRLALRVATDANATARVDTVRVRLERDLHATRRMAVPAGLVLVGYLLGRLVR